MLEQAKALLTQAKAVEQLRQAQAVVLPLSYGLSLDQTADALGISVSWACKLRTRFARGEAVDSNAKCGHRPRQNMNPEEEAAFLAPFLSKLKPAAYWLLAASSRHSTSAWGATWHSPLSTTCYTSHGWRKLAPDKRHPKPIRPICQAMVTQDTPMLMRRSRYRTANWIR